MSSSSRSGLPLARGGAGFGAARAPSRNASHGRPPSSASSSSHGPTAPPLSPSKERMRLAGVRIDGVGGSQMRQRGDDESNIQVVVRVRGGDAHPTSSILSTSGPHCHAITVAMEAPQVSSSASSAASTSVKSSLVTDEAEPSGKTYNFDHVFGPEADQGMVYKNVVGPILEEVKSGYNCTVFAYGQTGTGKTHTMEGDLTPHMGGTYSLEAGVIPRTLYRLFHDLESEGNEFSVHASFVELYNEELRDLLNNEPPTPLGHGSGNGGGGMKMFDDPKGRGVRIQGLEDTPLRDAQHGLALLRKGAQKRQIAATKCNEQSSRSHSVFALTVHIKETTAKGEDMLRTGKLNLVDLAGSENIGRSGAENERAREAGIINMSLLTLGRVINALVEKKPHIPYRESKLTRLLQESLGGRTKTCIIATVSPEKANLEETISTLAYALRAKSIRNRPEMNQRMTRAALIKEYVKEIERLKGDLLASREKNGIYHSVESWSAMQDEHEGAKKQIEELRRSDEVIKSKMNSLQEQFDQNMQLLVKRDLVAKAAEQESNERRAEVERLRLRLHELESAEEEERTLSQAYARSETKLNAAALSLKALLNNSKGDIDGLFAKLQRKSQAETRVSHKVVELQSSLNALATEMGSSVTIFEHDHADSLNQLSTRLFEFFQQQEQLAQEQVHDFEEKLQQIHQQVQKADGSSSKQKRTLDNIAADLDAARGGLLSATEARTLSLREGCKTLLEHVAASNGPAVESVKKSLSRMSDFMANIVQFSTSHLGDNSLRLQGVSGLVDRKAQEDVKRLEQQNEALVKLLLAERHRSSDAKAKITSLLSGLFDDREKALGETLESIQSGNKEAQEQTQSFVEAHSAAIEEIQEGGHRFHNEIEEAGQDCQKDRIKAERTVDRADELLRTRLSDFLEHDFSKLVDDELNDVRKTTEDVTKGVEALRNEADIGHATRREEVDGFANAMKGVCSEGAQMFENYLQIAREAGVEAGTALDAQRGAHDAFIVGTKDQVKRLRSHGQTDVLVKDQSTGLTPEKRKWQEADKAWKLVPKSRKLAIEQHRRRVEAAEKAGGTSVSVAFSEGSEDEMADMLSSGEEAEQEENEVDGLLEEGDETFTAKKMARNAKSSRGRSSSRSVSPVVSKKKAIASLGLGMGPGPRNATVAAASSAPLREANGNRLVSSSRVSTAPKLHKARPTSNADAITARRLKH